jgi:formate-dependent nitrite reductase membrane component NrfD
MKRYLGCLFLFMGISAACFVTGALMRVQHGKEESILAAESSLRAREQQIEEMTR